MSVKHKESVTIDGTGSSKQFTKIIHQSDRPQTVVQAALPRQVPGTSLPVPFPNNESLKSSTIEDPIDLGILDARCAERLISLYFEHFESRLGLLDPQIYTFQHIRATSLLLFTVLLSISGQVFARSRYLALCDHSELLLGKVLLSCDTEIGSIWAIVCLYHWKEWTSQRSYALCGFAVQLATSSEWHLERRRRQHRLTKDDGDQHAVNSQRLRQDRDQDRLWLYLDGMDKSAMCPRQVTMKSTLEWINVNSWFNVSQPHTYQFGDARALASREFITLVQSLSDSITSKYPRTTPTPLAEVYMLKRLVLRFTQSVADWSQRWIPIYASIQSSSLLPEGHLHIHYNYTTGYAILFLLCRLYACQERDTASITEFSRTCCTACINVLEQAIQLWQLGVLRYHWTSIHMMVVGSVQILLKVLNFSENDNAVDFDVVYGKVKEVADIYQAAAFPDGAAHYEHGNRVKNSSETGAKLLQSILLSMEAFSPQLPHYQVGRVDAIEGIQLETRPARKENENVFDLNSASDNDSRVQNDITRITNSKSFQDWMVDVSCALWGQLWESLETETKSTDS